MTHNFQVAALREDGGQVVEGHLVAAELASADGALGVEAERAEVRDELVVVNSLDAR